MADIGTDHGRLPLAMVNAGWVARAIGIDRAEAPLQSAQLRLARSGLGDRLQLRLGDGLGPLAPQEVDTVVVAGVGGATAMRILEPKRLGGLGVRRVVVQPNRDDVLVRQTLVAMQWHLVEEVLVYDGGRLFYTLAAEPGPSPSLGPADLWLGPLLRHQPGPLFEAFWMVRKAWLEQQVDVDPVVLESVRAARRN